jgi:glutathione-regulated potassium-efflux system ancillary protein KefG
MNGSRKVLILFAHPALQRSRVNARLVRAVQDLPGVTVNDLYERYPDFLIDVPREQDLLVEHDVVVFQHPMYWYSSPALLKEWQDLVLEYGFAYGSGGTALAGKIAFSAISTGGSREAYQRGGLNHFRIEELLTPFEQTCRLCGMRYLPPYVTYATHRLQRETEIFPLAQAYGRVIEAFTTGRIDVESAATWDRLDPAKIVPDRGERPHA